MSSLAPPERIWWKPLNREERAWVMVATVFCALLFISLIFWGAWADQDTPMESYKVTPQQYSAAATQFVNQYRVGTERGIPVVRPPAGGDAYLVGRTWQWTPILELKKGETYRIHLSSVDLQHGFSLQPLNLNLQVVPGYDQVITITPMETGEFQIVCNEYCGLGHHLMTGKIIVTE